MKKILCLVITGILLSCPLQAWGPLTHLSVNMKAYEEAVKDMGSTICIPREWRDTFISGGPAPDIKQPAGEKFSRGFHNDLETVNRMIDLAKKDARFGWLDVVEAIGWAGHLYAEVTTAHAENGYPNNNMTVVIPNAKGINHQLNELTIDILMYAELREDLRKLWVSMPIRLLEASMKAEQERDPSLPAMSATEIKGVANAFLPTVLGIRTIAEYLVQERPELVEEMNAFHGRRSEVVDESVREVVDLLKTHAKRDFTKANAKSADATDKVRVALEGSFTEKAKQFILNMGSKMLKTPGSNDIFTAIAYGSVKGLVSANLTRDRFINLVKSLATGGIWGGDNAKIVLSRYVEGLLLRHDLTYPEILVYCQEGITPDAENLKVQKTQFARLGLKEGGRAPVEPQKMREAISEVERMEAVRRSWPWFWPWRPSDLDLAKARERAGRLLAFYHIDHFPNNSFLTARASAFLKTNKDLRTRMQEYRVTSYFSPFKKYEVYKQIGSQSEAAGKDQRFFTDVLNITAAIGGDKPDLNQLSRLVSETSTRLDQTRQSLANAQQEKANTPFWNLIKRDTLSDQIKKLEETVRSLQDYQSALLSLQGNVAICVDEAAAAEAVAPANPLTPATWKTRYEKAYRDYVQLLSRKASNDPAVLKAVETLRALVRVRLQAKSGSAGN